ncbi:META domain-containing protein [Aquimarina sp. ERC-38]|uniref:META domain-containing protein n=1 Tax=Aquimarina sp. ERC-38 TaxID=2949996 RepID=UPI0022465F51|nr:META domain-containing protein [Aquimarina sp. ERC-38]UZO81151.1 META domain-containing protein [Aquimarina sp. ERC-38]
MKNLVIGILSLFLAKDCNSSNSQVREVAETTIEKQATTPEKPTQITGVVYKVMQLQTKSLTTNQPTVRMLPSENSVSGNSGCNSYTVSYTKEGDQYNFGYPMATKIFCEGSSESEFFTTLREIKTITQTKNKMIAQSKEGKILFEAVAIKN